MIGRQELLTLLNADFQSNKSSLIACYGRRRIGKSFLINYHIEKELHFQFEGLENQSPSIQINSFVTKIQQVFKINNSVPKINTWENALTYLTEQLPKNKKIIVFFDEFQWMTSGRSLLIALIKRFWDNEWKKYKIQLILCGSVSSYMIKNVIKSKALYGRINYELNIQYMPPNEAKLFFNKNKFSTEILKTLLVFGGVPKYLSDISQKNSFEQNIMNLFFDPKFGYSNEYEKIFYSQFKEHQIYEKIIQLIALNPNIVMEDLAKKMKLKSGGGLKSYLDNLIKAQFIFAYQRNPIDHKSKSKYYKILDPFLSFYLNFVQHQNKIIQSSSSVENNFQKATQDKLDIYLGHAFENFCFINAHSIFKFLKIENLVINYGPFYIPQKLQIDLLIIRNDNTIHIVEIKFQEAEIDMSIIFEIEKKLEKMKELFPTYSFLKTLITLSSPSKKLKMSEYFDHCIIAKDLL